MARRITDVGTFTADTRDIINQALAAAGIITQGRVFFVAPRTGFNGNDGLSPAAAFKTLAWAHAKCIANQNDVVMLLAESNTASSTTDRQSATLTWSKDLTHLIGVNSGAFLGQRSRIGVLSTATAFANLFTLSGNGCLIKGIEFFQGQMGTNPSAASTCVTVSGDRNRIVNCQISGIGHSELDDAGSNSLTVSGSENTFDGCYIGLDTIIRATSVTEVILSGTPTRNIFRDCHFNTYTSGSTFKMITVPTGADRFVKFLDCEFTAIQNITSAVAPTGVIGITTMNGQVLVRNPFVYGFAQLVTADNAYVQVLGFNGVATGHLVGIAQGVDAA